MSNTETARNNTRTRGSPSTTCNSGPSGSRSLIGIDAMIRIARSPLRTQYTSSSHARNPATNLACGHASAISN